MKNFRLAALGIMLAMSLNVAVNASTDEQIKFLKYERNSLLNFVIGQNGADWSPWQAMSDGHSNGIDFRWRRGSFQYDDGDREIFWQLRNRYQKSVRISFDLNYTRANSSIFTTKEDIDIDASSTADSLGQSSVAYSLTSFRVAGIRFLEE